MIICNIKRKDGSISSVQISGHSEYDDIGKDIVCAAVSALSIAAVNGLLGCVKIDLDYQLDEDGFISFQIPELNDEKMNLQADAILETLYIGLKGIELEYGKYIRLQVETEV